MRRTLAIGFCYWAIAVASAWGDEPLTPMAGHVAVDSLEVRSGPGGEFYATGELQRGSPVEVYREHSGGWLAIRPPAGSHAWVAADSLRVVDDSPVAHVNGDLVEAWVGSDMPGVRRHLWQVRLERNEAVELLGDQRLVTRADRGRETWLKIAPPAGEFRYVHREGVELQAIQRDSQVRQAGHTAAEKSQWRRSEDPAPPGGNAANMGDSADAATAVRQSAGGDELAGLDVALSFAVAQPLESWDLAQLKLRAEEAAEKGQSPLERGYARRMLEQIAEFEDLHFRWRLGQSVEAASFEASDDASGGEQLADEIGDEIGTGFESSEAAEPSSDSAELQYDGAGRLRKVYSKNQVAPPYVLRFVTPAPGLNLHRYLEEEVGVFGQVGQFPALQAPLITAQRIVRLERHRR